MKRNNYKNLCFFIIIMWLIILIFAGFKSTGGITTAFAEGEISYTQTPVITVLLHGLGGSPLDWNNNGNFNYSRDSSGQFISSSFEYRTDTLIEQLRQKNENSNVYILSEKKNSFVDENNNQILSLTDTAISRYDILEGEYQRTTTTNFDFTKHVIIVYDSKYQESETFSTEIVFQRFKKVMNAVVESYMRTYYLRVHHMRDTTHRPKMVWVYAWEEMKLLSTLPLSAEEKEKIFYKNALSLLNL